MRLTVAVTVLVAFASGSAIKGDTAAAAEIVSWVDSSQTGGNGYTCSPQDSNGQLLGNWSWTGEVVAKYQCPAGGGVQTMSTQEPSYTGYGECDLYCATFAGCVHSNSGAYQCEPYLNAPTMSIQGSGPSAQHRWQMVIDYGNSDHRTDCPWGTCDCGCGCDAGSSSTPYLLFAAKWSNETPCRRDGDSDGWSPDDDFPDEDCDDTNSAINPGITPWCDVPIDADNNCDGQPDYTQCESPIVVDVAGNGFRLTNKTDGVRFDLNGDGTPEALAWTAIGSDDAWLAVDRNGNGRIDNGGELFGNWTPQPPTTAPNGFIALMVFDGPGAGGNSNGWFDRGDAAFPSVVLWHDIDHDGISQAAELRTLAAVGIDRISLDYRQSARVDQWGNAFRYRARVIDQRHRDVGQWAYDVFLGAGRPGPNIVARPKSHR